MTQAQIEIHLHRKKRISHYPKLPKHILLKNVEGYKKPSRALMDSCERGFLKRLSNWMRMEGHAALAHMYTPTPKKVKVVADEEE